MLGLYFLSEAWNQGNIQQAILPIVGILVGVAAVVICIIFWPRKKKNIIEKIGEVVSG